MEKASGVAPSVALANPAAGEAVQTQNAVSTFSLIINANFGIGMAILYNTKYVVD